MATFRGVSLYDWASHFIPIVRWLPSYKVRSRAGHPALSCLPPYLTAGTTRNTPSPTWRSGARTCWATWWRR